ncbi:LacI family DNA-binding transcriptional regulator [Alkaliphilus hydrothermalis]|uniref:LacI family transcriptional regulator n=1 Tax=Alkaliphilus hydrothermalis TaxID=1482730 RepID=A0ABS2NQI2_9FIRM|nr:LacI family DNA-binding transcriptional regulator [Alkaliphilus hydrothermalis]MBM7615193.1 LacI family transcriptional regulator [Alkaliphilus hydrothermalis]
MKINIKDVARKAGVSISTVSRVINESKVVKPETYKKVMKVIEELGYKPNAIARSLKVKNTKTIGILIPDISNQFYPEVVRGIEDIANMYQYNIFLCNTDLDYEKEIKYFDALAEKQVDGVIFIGNIVSEELYKRFITYEIPVVSIGATPEAIPSVTIDYEGASKAMVKYLIQKGHQRIAMISGNGNDPVVGIARLEGYKKALMESNISIVNELILEGGSRFKHGYEAAIKLLEMDEPPTAIFVANDEMAIGTIRAALENGYSIPEELAIVGFDNIDMASKIYPALTTVA